MTRKGNSRAILASAVDQVIRRLRRAATPSVPCHAIVQFESLEPRIVFGGKGDGLSPLTPPVLPPNTCPPSPIMNGGPGNGGPGGSGPGGSGPGGSGPGGSGPGGSGPGGSGSGGPSITTMPIVAAGGSSAGNGGGSDTAAPVESFDGTPVINSEDLTSSGFGFNWGITRSWVGGWTNGPLGNGWAVMELPYVVPSGLAANSTDPPPDAANVGSYPDLRLTVVDGLYNYQFATPSPPTSATYAPWGGQPIGTSLTYDSTNQLLTLTDPAGDQTVFYDVDRDPTTAEPIIGALPSAFAGKFKSYTTADGSVSVTTSYDTNGNLLTMTRSDSATSQNEEWDFTYSTITNDLVTTAGDTAPYLATNIAWKQNGTVIRKAVYDYYTGRLPDGMGGYIDDPNGRLGDLRSVTIEDGSGNTITQDYYRYYKFTGESDYTGDQGPGNDPATTGGPDPLQPTADVTYDPTDPGSGDILVTSGLKTVVTDASFTQLSSAIPGYQTASDTAIQPYVNHLFNYERWGDHEGADGQPGLSAGYNDNLGYFWRINYRFGTQYRVTSEIAQGAGCSTCSGGQGAYKYEYAANYGNQPPDDTSLGYGVIDYNTWRMKQTIYLPDDTAGTWADNNREIIYTNEVGQPLLDVNVEVAPTPITITAMSVVSGTTVQVSTSAAHGLNTGDTVALTGVLPEIFNGVFKITVVDADTFDITVPVTYFGYASMATPYVNSAYNGNAYAAKVLSQDATYYRYDDEGRLIETADAGAVTAYDDSQMDLVDADSNDPNNGAVQTVMPLGLISPNQGQVQTAVYSGWAFDGRAGIAANSSSLGNPDAPNGSQAGFLQDVSVVSQTVGGWTAGTYTLSFQSAEAAGTSSTTESFAVYLDNTLLTFSGGTETSVSPGSSYASYTTDAFTATPGMHQIRFVGLGDTTMGTAFVDQVSVSSGGPTVTDGSFETDSLGSGNYATNPFGYALTATSSTGGTVAGKFAEAWVQQGQDGTPSPLESVTYYAHTAGSKTVFPVATDTVYGNADGTDARTTRYSYAYYSGTNALYSQTTIAPPITASQNGPATSTSDTTDADTSTEVFDPEGRVIWTKDGGGFLTYTGYDDPSGGVTTSIQDVNTADTSEFSNLPSGWSTPSGGGLNLMTTDQVDLLGRTTEETDPNGNVTYTVYNDPGHETRVYPGWHEVGSTWTTTGPIQVETDRLWGTIVSGQATATGTTTTLIDTTNLSASGNYVGYTVMVTSGTDAGQSAVVKSYDPSTHTLTLWTALTAATDTTTHYTLNGLYSQTLTTSATPTVNGSHQPTGLETISSSNIQSLSRSLANNAGQMIEQDDYFSLSGASYSTSAAQLGASSNNSASGNYGATIYHYNGQGLQDIVTDPTGTITRNVYDGMQRLVSTWVGTDDTPASGYWSPTNNTSPSNMVDVEDYYYDQRQAGPTSAPTLGETPQTDFSSHDYAFSAYVLVTYLTAAGETAPSPVGSYSVDDSYLLTVASPASISGATGYNLYVGFNGGPLLLQNSTPISLGTDWTEPNSGLTPGPSIQPSGTGDSNLTEIVQHPGGGAADRVTLNLYDWRNRLIATKQGALLASGVPNPSGETDSAHRLITYTSYDNLNQLTANRTYAGDAVNLNDFATWTTSTDTSDLRAYSTQTYDDQGRVYLANTYSVDPSSGTVGASLATTTYYDHRGNVIETSSPGGQVTKSSFDGAGRDVMDSTTDGGVINGATQNWTNAGSTTNDVVIEQTLKTYDAASNLIETVDKQRFDNDSTSSTGDLGGPSSGINSRNYYAASYYDADNRQTDSVNVGTNAGSSWTRPSTVPTGSDTVLVTHIDYDLAGRILDTVDPRGIKAATFYDLLGRPKETISAWDGTGSPSPATSSNQITVYTYDGDGNVLTQTAVMPSGTNNQTTAYLYGTSSTSAVFSNDLLAKTEYPDLSTGSASTSAANDETITYNALGQKTSYLDRDGSTHAYSYDVLGRLVSDVIPTGDLGSGISNQTLALGYSYNDAGLPFKQTTYSNSAMTTVENQDEDVYNGYGQLTIEYQETSGAVNTSTSASVQYAYSQPTGTNYSRLTSMTYPNGRLLDYGYNSGIDTTISRVSYLKDDGGSSAGVHLADYLYLGLTTIVQQDSPEASTELTYIHQTGDTLSSSDGGDRYTGLDRFGRVIDQYYLNTSTSTATDRLQYGYDRSGNVLYSKNLVNGAFSELYHASSGATGDNNTAYDPLNRLTTFRRGTLTSSGNNGTSLDTITTANLNSTTGVPNTNSWTLDAMGNWSSAGGTSGTFNSQNEQTASGSTSLTYDNAGNMITDESGNTYTYDAWGHAISIVNGSSTTALHYDALGRNVLFNNGSGNDQQYYSRQRQVVEEKFSGAYEQYVWGLAYVNDLVVRDRNADNLSTGNLGITGSGLEEREYFQHNVNWSTISYTNQTGTVGQRFVYDPYGTVTTLDNSWAISTATSNYTTYLFQGMRVLGGYIYLSQTRLYDVKLGRWGAQDPDRYVDGPNLFAIERSNPSNGGDPSGRTDITRVFRWTIYPFEKAITGIGAGLGNGIGQVVAAGGDICMAPVRAADTGKAIITGKHFLPPSLANHTLMGHTQDIFDEIWQAWWDE
jgi:RHS repeat-associated protein